MKPLKRPDAPVQVHYLTPALISLCHAFVTSGRLRTTTHIAQVTCPACLKRLTPPAKAA